MIGLGKHSSVYMIVFNHLKTKASKAFVWISEAPLYMVLSPNLFIIAYNASQKLVEQMYVL